MKKTMWGLLSLLVLLLFGMNAFAWQIGDRLTQEQVNSLDTETITIPCSNYVASISNAILFVKKTCANIDYNNDVPSAPYIIFADKQTLIGVPIGTVFQEVLQFGATQTIQKYVFLRNRQKEEFLSSIRKRLRGYQTNSVLNDLLNNLNQE
jgi:hypothetical protein